MARESLIQVENLTVRYPGAKEPILRDVSLTLYHGEITCVIGESGCGKSTMFHAIEQLPGRVVIDSGSVSFRGRNLQDMSKSELRALRGRSIGVVFQEPGASLDPIRKIWVQFYEAMRAHDPAVTKAQARERAAEILRSMEFTDPERILDNCPAQLSGGMNQRVAIAMAMALNPEVLLADEPTSALDVTVQAQIVNELMLLTERFGTCILLITHNMGVVAKMAHRVAVMYGGRIIEYGPKNAVLSAPKHPYTKALLAAIPRLDGQPPTGIPGKKPDVFPAVGCAFAPRCSRSCEACKTAAMTRRVVEGEHWTMCQEVELP